MESWFLNCLCHGMLDLTPPSEDSATSVVHRAELSEQSIHSAGANSKTSGLLTRFNPQLIGFGIADLTIAQPIQQPIVLQPQGAETLLCNTPEDQP
jgi:hypothetical protein